MNPCPQRVTFVARVYLVTMCTPVENNDEMIAYHGCEFEKK